MKKLYITIILTMLLVSLVFAADPIAVVIKSKGTLTLLRNKISKDITSGEQLYNGDVLKTGKGSFAALRFSDASSLVKVFPNSQITVKTKKNGKKYDKTTILTAGNIWSKVVKKTGKFDIETPTTVVSVKGTKFLVGYDKDDKNSIIYTFEGVVLVQNKADKFIKEVHPGEKAISKGKGVIGFSTFNKKDIKRSFMDYIEEDENIYEFDMQKSSGAKKHIKMKFE